MKIKVYDLIGKNQITTARAIEMNAIEISQIEATGELLVYPKSDSDNRQPYIQNQIQPNLEDFSNSEGAYSYDNSFFIKDIIENELVGENGRRFNSFFANLTEGNENESEPIKNIIPVPDHFGTDKQEQILRNCHLKRSETLLLWRSVAICLGAEEQLNHLGAAAGARIAVIDIHNLTVNASILELKNDGDFIVPARKAYNLTSNLYYHGKLPTIANEPQLDRDTLEFWQHTFHQEGKFLTPKRDGGWQYNDFHLAKTGYNIDSTILDRADFVIVVCDSKNIIVTPTTSHKVILEQSEQDFVAIGSTRFAQRQQLNLPTYFDQCEGLSFIIQNMETETIESLTLIEKNEFCRGGAKIIGTEIRDLFIPPSNSKANFLLAVGEVYGDTTLKTLEHDFGKETSAKQPLVLYPSMIPGQGIATVEVLATPLIRGRIILDFLKMQESNKTINSMQNDMKRSFPIDMPDVDADAVSHSELINQLNDYLFLDKLDGGIFAHSTFPYSYEKSINRFKRTNTFGRNPNRRYPMVDAGMIQYTFYKLAEDYQIRKQNNESLGEIIRAIAWTYQFDNPLFVDVISDTLKRIEIASRGEGVVLAQEFTLCANLLSTHEQYLHFIKCFMRKCKQALGNSNQRRIGIDDWLRALSEILMFHNDALEYIDSSMATKCANLLCRILKLYVKNNKGKRYVKVVLKTLLFLLKRRKYDKTFLRIDTDTNLYSSLISICHEIDNNLFYYNISDLANLLIHYLEGKGTLEGLAATDD